MARNLGMDRGVLEAALMGYMAQRDAIQKKIDELKAELGPNAGRKATAAVSAPKPQKPHRISPEGLKRIRDAQKRRWAAAKAQAAKAANA